MPSTCLTSHHPSYSLPSSHSYRPNHFYTLAPTAHVNSPSHTIRHVKLRSKLRGTLCVTRANSAIEFPCGSSLRGILFDIDGTLADSDPLHLKVFRERFIAEGFAGGSQFKGKTNPIDDEFFIQHLCGRSDVDVLTEMFPERSLEEVSRMAVEKDELFQEAVSEGLQCVKGLQSLLTAVERNGVRCVAVTNASRGNAEKMLEALNLSEEFVDLIIGSECEHAKPHPAPYIAGLKALGLEADACLAMEDSPSGARAAVAAGIATVGVMTRQRSEALEASGCALTITDFDDDQLWSALKWDR